MDSAHVLLEQIELHGFQVTVAPARVDALCKKTGDRFVVRGGKMCKMALVMLEMIGRVLKDSQ